MRVVRAGTRRRVKQVLPCTDNAANRWPHRRITVQALEDSAPENLQPSQQLPTARAFPRQRLPSGNACPDFIGRSKGSEGALASENLESDNTKRPDV
jgi:hypothetical protein